MTDSGPGMPAQAGREMVDADDLVRRANAALAADNLPAAARFAIAAIERAPESLEALRAAANVFMRLQRYPAAEALLREGLARAPQDFAFQLNLSLLLFRQRRYGEAWPLVGSHLVWRRVKGEVPPALGGLRSWRPDAPPTASVLVWTDGLTEPLLFLPLVEELRARGPRVALAVPPRLVALARRSLPGVTVGPCDGDLRPMAAAFGATHHLPALGLGYALRRTVEAFRGDGIRAAADGALVTRLRARHRGSGPLVGIAWSTRNPAAAHKSIALDRLLAALPPGARALSLQYGDLAAELAALPSALRDRLVVDPEIDPLGDFDPFAALVASCDATLTTSGLAAHLAGRLGVPSVVLVPIGLASAWYWHDGDGPSLWYPATTIVHQRRRFDWDDVLARAAPALARALG